MQNQQYDALLETSQVPPKRRTWAFAGAAFLMACSGLALMVRQPTWPASFAQAAKPQPFESISLVSLKGEDVGLQEDHLMEITDQHPWWEHMPETDHELVSSKTVSFFMHNRTDSRLYAKLSHPELAQPIMLYVCCKGVFGHAAAWYTGVAKGGTQGAGVGAATGATGGAFVGGVGAVPGALAGAATGAIGGALSGGINGIRSLHGNYQKIFYVFGGCKSTC